MCCSPPGSSVLGISEARILEQVAFPPPGDLPNPGIEPMSPRSPALQADALPLSHQGSPEMGRDQRNRGKKHRHCRLAGREWEGLQKKRPWPSWPADWGHATSSISWAILENVLGLIFPGVKSGRWSSFLEFLLCADLAHLWGLKLAPCGGSNTAALLKTWTAVHFAECLICL